MSRDSNGDYTLPAGVNPVVAATTITDDWANTTLQDVATALTDSLDRQGRGAPLANLSMGSFKLTTLAAATAAADAPKYSQVINQDLATIASAATTDLAAAMATIITVTGTTGITSFGTGAAEGVVKIVQFSGALTITHNATSLILPGAANYTTSAGDSCLVKSLGSNNWRVLSVFKNDGSAVVTSPLMADGTVSVPGIRFASDTDTGLYRTTSNQLKIAAGGTEAASFSNTTTAFYASAQTFTSTRFTAFNSTFEVADVVVNSGTGTLTLKTDNASGSTGAISMAAGNSSSAGVGGSVTISAGDSTSTAGGVGGDLTISAGDGHATTGSNTGGDLAITAGNGTVGGDVNVTAGNATGAASAGGDIKLKTGSTVAGLWGKLIVDSTIVSTKATDGAPTIASGGGTGATIAGSGFAGQVTFGTGSPTSVVISVPGTFATAPFVVATGSQSGQIIHVSATTTQITISSSAAFNSGTKVSYIAVMPE